MSTKSYQSFRIKYKGASTLIIKKKLSYENKKAIIISTGFILGYILILLLNYFYNHKDREFLRWFSVFSISYLTLNLYFLLKPQYFVFDKIKDQFKVQKRVLQKLSEVKCIELVAYSGLENPNIFRLYIVGQNDYTFHWLDIGSDELELMAVAGELSEFLGVPVVKVENEKMKNR